MTNYLTDVILLQKPTHMHTLIFTYYPALTICFALTTTCTRSVCLKTAKEKLVSCLFWSVFIRLGEDEKLNSLHCYIILTNIAYHIIPHNSPLPNNSPLLGLSITWAIIRENMVDNHTYMIYKEYEV